MSYQTIGSGLKSVIDAVKAAPWSALVSTFDHDAPDADTGYPYAVVSVKQSTEEESDTFTNSATYSFAIRVVDLDKDKSAMEARMRTLADQVLAELRKKSNAHLGGDVERLAPFSVTWWWDQSANVPSRIFEVSVDATVRWTVS